MCLTVTQFNLFQTVNSISAECYYCVHAALLASWRGLDEKWRHWSRGIEFRSTSFWIQAHSWALPILSRRHRTLLELIFSKLGRYISFVKASSYCTRILFLVLLLYLLTFPIISIPDMGSSAVQSSKPVYYNSNSNSTIVFSSLRDILCATPNTPMGRRCPVGCLSLRWKHDDLWEK